MKSQTVDTANNSFQKGADGYYSQLINKKTVNGIAAGNIISILAFDIASIDTAKWKYLRDQTGYINSVVNSVTFYGIAPGNVRAMLTNSLNNTSSSANLYGYVYKDSLNTFTAQQKLTEGTASLNALGGNNGTITINKQTGIASITNQVTLASGQFGLTLSNSLITTNSVIICSLQIANSPTGLTTALGFILNSPSAGSVTFLLTNYDIINNFTDDFKIHFVVFNP